MKGIKTKARQKETRKFLPELVYGGTDGAITTFAVVAGAIGASLSSTIIIILGFANLLADGFSMAASNYLSSESQKEIASKHFLRFHAGKKPIESAIATFISFGIIGFMPLLPFVLATFYPSIIPNQFFYSAILTAFAFLIVGSFRGIITGKHPLKSAIETICIGSLASLLAFIAGYFIHNILV